MCQTKYCVLTEFLTPSFAENKDPVSVVRGLFEFILSVSMCLCQSLVGIPQCHLGLLRLFGVTLNSQMLLCPCRNDDVFCQLSQSFFSQPMFPDVRFGSDTSCLIC